MSFLGLYLSGLAAAGTPSITPNTPTNGATSVSTTPQLAFTGVTSDGVQKIEYEIQVDTQSDFKSGGSYSTPTKVQSVFNSAGVNNQSFVSAPTVGNVIIVMIAKAGAQSAAPLDDANNTYTLIKSTHETTTGNWIDIYMASVTRTRAALNVRIGNTASTWAIAEYSGVDPTATILTATAQSGSGTPSSSITTTVANSLIVVMGYDEGTVAQTAGSGFTLQGNEADNATYERAIFMDGVFASTGSQTITWANGVAAWAITAICLEPFKSTVPVLDKFSATDSGFANITTPANTHPFPSGEQIGYTPASALTASTTYYWRVRQIPTQGNTNYLPDWSSTFSFTTAAGGGGTTVTPGLGATLVLTAFAPTVAVTANVTLTPGIATLVLTAQTPTVRVNTILTPGIATLTLTAQTPTIAVSNNKSAIPGIGTLTLTANAPTVSVSNNVTLTPGIGTMVLTAFAPTVSAGASFVLTPGVASLTLTAQTPTVTTSNNISLTPGTATLTLTGFAPTVVAISSHELPFYFTLSTTATADTLSSPTTADTLNSTSNNDTLDSVDLSSIVSAPTTSPTIDSENTNIDLEG